MIQRALAPLAAMLAACILLLANQAVAQDGDGDTFAVSDGDCDDSDGQSYPGATEICDDVDNDCDGQSDEAGSSPILCDTNPDLVSPFENDVDGNLIMHLERWLPSVDLTGVDLYQSVQANLIEPGGPMTNVQSILIRNWMGTSSYQVIANAIMTFPAGVTVHGWIIDRQGGSPINRSLDSTFSTVPGGLNISETNNTQFENSNQDYAYVTGQLAVIHTYIASAADEARLIISYDPHLNGPLRFEVNMGTGAIQDLTVCSEDMPGTGSFNVPLTSADNDLLDGDGDGMVECHGDCDDGNALIYDGADELCDEVDNDCDNVVPGSEIDDDGDSMAECEGDCNDGNDDIYDAAPELCDDLDNDCDGSVGGDEIDNDGDGTTECDGDCNDGNEDVVPGAGEQCNGIDDDCDLLIDEDFDLNV